MAKHPNVSIIEMDTVYNDVSNRPLMQTFQFVDYHFMTGIYHQAKTSQEMLEGVQQFHSAIGEEDFNKLFEVILTDCSSEFVCAEEIEKLSCHVFYCDSMSFCQKPHVENNHNLFHFICPSEKDLKKIGHHSGM